MKPKSAFILQDGDIIFQRSLQPEHLVMNFIDIGFYNHCGIIVKREGKYFVLSAEKTVTYTSLKKWIKKGEGEKFRILRPQKKMQRKISYTIKQALFHKGKIYDFQFTWDDKKIYNSELIQKAFYKGSNIYLGEFIKVTGVSVSPQDSILFNSCKGFIPYGKEIVTVNSIFNSSYLKMLMLKK